MSMDLWCSQAEFDIFKSIVFAIDSKPVALNDVNIALQFLKKALMKILSLFTLGKYKYHDVLLEGESDSLEPVVLSTIEQLYSSEDQSCRSSTNSKPLMQDLPTESTFHDVQGNGNKTTSETNISVDSILAAEGVAKGNQKVSSIVSNSKKSKSESTVCCSRPAKKSKYELKQRNVNELYLHRINFLEFRCFICSNGELYEEASFFGHILTFHAKKGKAPPKRTLTATTTEETEDTFDAALWDKSYYLECPYCQAPFEYHHGANPKRLEGAHMETKCLKMLTILFTHLWHRHNFPIPPYLASFPCKIEGCKYISPTYKSLKTHERNHVVAKCDICQGTYKGESLKRHQEICGKSKSQVAKKCPYCEKHVNARSLYQHIRRIHEGKHSHFCHLCEYKSFNKTDLENHLFKVHPSDEHRAQGLACPICNNVFRIECQLRAHVKQVHEAGNFPCDVCGRVFATKNKLSSHRGHAHSGPFTCSFCPYVTKSKSNIQKHEAAQHTEPNKFKCSHPGCCYSSGWKANLDKHQKNCKFQTRMQKPTEFTLRDSFVENFLTTDQLQSTNAVTSHMVQLLPAASHDKQPITQQQELVTSLAPRVVIDGVMEAQAMQAPSLTTLEANLLNL